MKTLPTELRQQLERAVIEARDVAEAGAHATLEELAVHHHESYGHMDTDQRKLRRRLRAHARQLGDRLQTRRGEHTIEHLVQETAYEQWHSMLFARFLAENGLLIEPENDVAVTLDECEDLAREKGSDKWTLASQYAHSMLPQVFRTDQPGLEVRFAREYQMKLESLVEGLPALVFTATDSLGWVYQFWQTVRKNEVNDSEVKIGADELPAVTQLFTEPYMVQFLLHNSLGAWWQIRHPGKRCPVDLTYLRQTENGTPVAGGFEGWPDDLSMFRLLDPCCGSGHFLVAAFLMLVPMRMVLENIGAAEAADAVLLDNLHGLELDQRCLTIAAFALAIEAWRYPSAGGYRSLPRFNLAWCGQPVVGKREQWMALPGSDRRMENGMGVLYDIFKDAPLLGSLIDPTSMSEDILTAGFSELQSSLEQALSKHAGEEEWEETAIAALGLTEANRLMSQQYHLVITNVPYLSRSKQNEHLRDYVDKHYARAKNDLANVFLERCLELCREDGEGVTQIVMPQNWLFLTSYKAQRERLLKQVRWNLLVRLGSKAFQTPMWDFNVQLLTLTRTRPHSDDLLFGIDVSTPRTAAEKAKVLRSNNIVSVRQQGQLSNPDARVTMEEAEDVTQLAIYASAFQGVSPADTPHYARVHWELSKPGSDWINWQSSIDKTTSFSGKETILWYGEDLKKAIANGQAYLRGTDVIGKRGVVVRHMGELSCALHTGAIHDTNCAIVLPFNENHLPAIWCFCSSPEYNESVRQIDQKLNVTNATLVKVPFDLVRWTKVAQNAYPKGLPKAFSNDPTQWIFHGHPCGSVIWDEDTKWTANGPRRIDPTVLQVAVARLLGFRWPAEYDSDIELADEARAWVEETTKLHPIEDGDGIACIPSVRGERPAHERLLQLLQAAWEDDWSDDILAKLLTTAQSSSLDDWLRNRFFEEHCKLFHQRPFQRPFLWHIWDGRRRDGFHALVNYHKLVAGGGKGRRLLESLTYSYLGNWISRQQDGVRRSEDGAEDRLAAALELKRRLEAILVGESPFDLFIRWKPIDEQPIGWEPDINDGVRLNIRPFLAEDLPNGKKGAGVLRSKPKIHWGKDRGKEPMRDKDQFPWFWENGTFTGDRINDVHWTRAEKHAAQSRLEE